jgi:retron-type reverse transcriptase
MVIIASPCTPRRHHEDQPAQQRPDSPHLHRHLEWRRHRHRERRATYLLSYQRLYSNKGAMTPGISSETVDGMSLAKIELIIEALRHERYRFKPVKRVHIPKNRGR